MNKKFGNKFYTLITDNYIEKKGLFKTVIIHYKDIKKIYITVPRDDNKETNLKFKYNYKISLILNNEKKQKLNIYTKRNQFLEILNFLSSFNIVIQTKYYDDRAQDVGD